MSVISRVKAMFKKKKDEEVVMSFPIHHKVDQHIRQTFCCETHGMEASHLLSVWEQASIEGEAVPYGLQARIFQILSHSPLLEAEGHADALGNLYLDQEVEYDVS